MTAPQPQTLDSLLDAVRPDMSREQVLALVREAYDAGVRDTQAEAAVLRDTLRRAADLVADLVRADNNRYGSGPEGRITGTDTLRLQQLLGLSLSLREVDRIPTDQANQIKRMLPVVEASRHLLEVLQHSQFYAIRRSGRTQLSNAIGRLVSALGDVEGDDNGLSKPDP